MSRKKMLGIVNENNNKEERRMGSWNFTRGLPHDMMIT